ncbi:hypothetical protein ANN_07229 [Periplaneta americana]|uniref:Uncharacterized protein n=1 Tax=Periplaneta americana TaxID=6978 RepID=A0ABQ8TGA9_PERAM|nr:hypothetical protein ANN_07229 [Periplaneta americana]
MVGLCEGGNEPPGSLKATFARIGLRENPGKNLNQVTCPDQDSNRGHLVSRPDALTVTPRSLMLAGSEFQSLGRAIVKEDEYEEVRWDARSPDMNPIEHVWDMLGRCVKNRRPRPESLQELRRALGEEWELIPQEDIANKLRACQDTFFKCCRISFAPCLRPRRALPHSPLRSARFIRTPEHAARLSAVFGSLHAGTCDFSTREGLLPLCRTQDEIRLRIPAITAGGDHRANHTIPPFWLDDRPPLLRHVGVRSAAGWSV